MAGINSTATTPKELAEQFPPTIRPFAVWYNDNPGCDSRKWAVNDESGEATQEFEDLATALKAAAEMISECGWDAEARKQAQALAEILEPIEVNARPNQKQIEMAFERIATMANSLQRLCGQIVMEDNGGPKAMAASIMAQQIGWLADRCNGFDVKESNEWLLPHNWKKCEAQHA